ncbi:MAG: DUF2208 domain-containing protein [Desulfurococcales archaeon]|nr:DUF2208 domain-containing protein [Desulfurococcales archaeon]
MSYVENLRSRMLLSQAFMVLYSLLAAILGRGTETFIIILILVIMMGVIQSRKGKGPLGTGKADPEEILSGKKLYSEEKIRELQMKDEKLVEDIQDQSKFSIYSSLGAFLGIGYFILLWPEVEVLYNYFISRVDSEILAHFLAFLIFFEGLFIINQLSMVYALRKIGKVTMMNIPQSYTVTDRGIVFKGLIGKTGIRFPLPDTVDVKVNTKRGFVEIINTGKRSVTKVRLYARNPRRLYDIIKKYGIQKSSEG